MLVYNELSHYGPFYHESMGGITKSHPSQMGGGIAKSQALFLGGASLNTLGKFTPNF